jgi:hypothetical protein
MIRASAGKEDAVDGVTTIASGDEVIPTHVFDTSAIPLDQLAMDLEVRQMVTRVLDDMEEPAPVAAFSSAI